MSDQEQTSEQKRIAKLLEDLAESNKRLAEAEKRNQKTTLRELLQACHES